MSDSQKKPRKRPTNTYLLLASNALSTLTPLPKVIDLFFIVPEKLQWLDVSNNHLTTIEPVLLQFTNLMMLYMHGNQVRALKAHCTGRPCTKATHRQ